MYLNIFPFSGYCRPYVGTMIRLHSVLLHSVGQRLLWQKYLIEVQLNIVNVVKIAVIKAAVGGDFTIIKVIAVIKKTSFALKAEAYNPGSVRTQI